MGHSGLIYHSDQGVQYAANDYIERLLENGIRMTALEGDMRHQHKKLSPEWFSRQKSRPTEKLCGKKVLILQSNHEVLKL